MSNQHRGRGAVQSLVLFTMLVIWGCGSSADPQPAVDSSPSVVSEDVGDDSNSDSTASPDSTASTADPDRPSEAASEGPPTSTESDTGSNDATSASGVERFRESFAAFASDDGAAKDAAVFELDAAGGESRRAAAETLASDAADDVRLGAAFYLLDRFEASDAVQVAGVAAALQDSQSAVRNIALQLVLRSERLTKENLPTVGRLIVDSESAASSRVRAIRGLAKMPDEAQTVLPMLRQATEAAESEVRSAAVYTISRVDPSPEGVAVLVRRLQADSDPAIRRLAAVRLGRMPDASAAAVDGLIEALGQTDQQAVREAAADALGRLGPPAVSALTRTLSSPDAQVRRHAVYALGKNGGAADSALPKLRKLAEADPDPEVRDLAKLTVRVIETSN